MDGNITKDEISSLRKNLRTWNNENARLIIHAINLIDPFSSSANIINLFKKTTEFSSIEEKSVMNCLDFLNDSSPSTKKLIYQQIVSLIKADGHVHKNERWIWYHMKQKWNINK